VNSSQAVWRVGWRLAVCAVLLAWIFHSIFLHEGQLAWQASGQLWHQLPRRQQWRVAWTEGPAGLWRTLTLIHPSAFAGSLVFMGLTIVLGVFRWRIVMRVQGLELPLSRALEISLVAHFFNSFLLGSTGGDLLKAYYAARETHHKKTEAVVTVIVDRLIGLLAMLLFAWAMILLNRDLIFAHGRLGALAWLVLAMLLGCAGVIALAFWGGLSRPLPSARAWLRRLPKGELLERCVDASRAFGRRPGFLLEAFALSMAVNTACVLQVFTLARGLGLPVQPLDVFVIVPIVVCISALPITPSGLGLRENLYVLLFAVPAIGVNATQALSLSLLAYAGSLLWSLAGGVVYVRLKEARHLEQVTRPTANGTEG
jgi:uncharacterized membrane protein YbhN (UPF0104 family)